MSFLSALFGKRPEMPKVDNRTAIKSQSFEEDLQLNALEQSIGDTFDKLPRSCRRIIERAQPKSWIALQHLVDEHPQDGKHGH